MIVNQNPKDSHLIAFSNARENHLIQSPAGQVIVYGAIQGYEYYQELGLLKEAEEAKKTLLSLADKYTFEDEYTKQTLHDFCSLARSGGDIKAWWDNLKVSGLVSSNAGQPKLYLTNWVEQNISHCKPDELPHDEYLNTANFILYTDLLFLQREREDRQMGDSDLPGVTNVIRSFFSASDSDTSAHAGIIALQIYKCHKSPELGGEEWNAFAEDLKILVKDMDPTGQKGGIYLNLLALASGVIPDPYTSAEEYFESIEHQGISPTSSSMSIVSDYHDKHDSENVRASFTKLKADIESGNINAAVQDYANLSKTPKKPNTYEASLIAAAKEWAQSVQVNKNIINATFDIRGGHRTESLTSRLIHGDGIPVTLYDLYEKSREEIVSVRFTKVSYPAYDFPTAHTGSIEKIDGTTICKMSGGGIGGLNETHDSDVLPKLKEAFENKIEWSDRNGQVHEFEFEASGKVDDILNAGKTDYLDISPNSIASKIAANKIAGILSQMTTGF